MSKEPVEQSDTMRYPYGDLAILSAEVFPGSPYNNTRTTTAANSNNASKRSQSTKKATPSTKRPDETSKKRARTQTSGHEEGEGEDEDKKRSRGRPRLDAKDESAADRRRTQIRLAQRAYRNRKENAITTLEKEVQELKDTNEEMSNAFMQLHDFATKNGILDQIPELGRQLRETTEKILSLARSANEEGDNQQQAGGSSDNSSPRSRDKSSPPDPTRGTQPKTASENVSNPQLYGGLMVSHEPVARSDFLPDFSSSFNPPAATTTSVLGYEIVAHPTIDNASFAFQPGPSLNLFEFQSPSPYNQLSLPKTYAAHEGTFGRRLQRFAIERAYILITMPSPPQAKMNRVFGFCLLFESFDSIRRRLARQIARDGQEALHNWEFPFFNLGGAGTHYDATAHVRSDHRMGNQGTRDVLKPTNTSGYGIGPWSAEVNNVRDNSLDRDMRMDEPGFDGEFMDCDEVEIYLYQRGVVIPPGTDYVTADIDPNHFDNNQPMMVNVDPFNAVIAAATDNTSASFLSTPFSQPPNTASPPGRSPGVTSGSGSSISNPSPPHHSEAPWHIPASSSVDPALPYSQAESFLTHAIATSSTGDLLSGMFTGFSEPSSNPLASSFEGLRHSQPTQKQHQASPLPRKQRVYFDVDHFLKALVNNARCLGRTPGFKQMDVNDAFWQASEVRAS
ncbi:hypothetical protein QBC43DRAFT_71575 [Cladorrhinum sp. PSN259]|nr:hypothetical protein QBC43DRAFT_71575 [Cladorrhinum sp. PSN259]